MSDDICALIDSYAAGPTLLRSVLENVATADYDAIPVPGTWSVRQVVCHIADFEPVYVDRFKRVLVENNPTLLGGNPDAYAAGLFYSHRSVEDELSFIESTRKHMTAILRNCDIEQFQLTGVHSEDGPMTLETLLTRIVGHIPHHVKFIEAKIAALQSH